MGQSETPKRPGAAPGAGRRRSMGPLASSVERVTKRVLGRRALAEASLIAEWPSIAGSEFACACQPRRLVFPTRKDRREATLVLRVKPGEATRIAHLEPVLVERVNGYFGYQAVKRLRLEQAQLETRGRAPQAPPKTRLSPRDSAAAQERIDRIADPELRDALARLGRRLGGGA